MDFHNLFMVIIVSKNFFKIMVSGTEKFIDSLLNLMDHEPSVLLGAVRKSVFIKIV